MRLTDADVIAMRDANQEWINAVDSPLSPQEWLYLAGKRAGAEAMRERAAKACDPIIEREWDAGQVDHNEIPWSLACEQAIRALGVDDD